MEPAAVIRWSGLVTMVGGALLALSTAFHPTKISAANVRAFAYWVPVHTFITISVLLILFGLIGLYASQMERAGMLGFIGFLIAFLGTAMFVGLLFFDGFVSPVLAVHAPNIEEHELIKAPGFVGYALIQYLSFFIGYIIFGIATMRAGVLPRWGGLLLIIGAPALLIGAFLMVPVVGRLSGVLLGAGLVWLGYAVWMGETAGRAAPSAVPAGAASPGGGR